MTIEKLGRKDVRGMDAVNNIEVGTVTAKEEVTKMPKKRLSRVNANSADTRYEEMTLALTDIEKDDELFRCRLKEDKATIEKYAALYRENKEAEVSGEEPLHQIKPILVWYDKARRRYVLLGGYHRIEAALMAGYTEMVVIIFYGTEDDAFSAASRDNAAHGLRLNDGDKTHLVRKSLERFGDTKKYREIASDVGCAYSLVSKVYKELFGQGKKQARLAVSSDTQAPNNGNVVALPVTDDIEPFDFEEDKKPEKSIEEQMIDIFDRIDNLLDGKSVKEGKGFFRGLFKRYGRIYNHIKRQGLLHTNQAIIVKDEFVEAWRR